MCGVLMCSRLQVAHANVSHNADGTSRGFGVAKFANIDEAQDAVDGVDGAVIEGRELRAHVDRSITGHGDKGWKERQQSRGDGLVTDEEDEDVDGDLMAVIESAKKEKVEKNRKRHESAKEDELLAGLLHGK